MMDVAADVPGAFERLVGVYEGRVKALVARSLSTDRSSVEDLAQEVFLRLFRSRQRYRPTARFETFLYRVVFNACINHTQKAARRRALSLDAPQPGLRDEPPSLPDPAARLPSENLERAERARLVRQVVDDLPENQRRALLLSRFEGLGYAEVAEVMEVTVPAVKSLLWRARENLRKGLAPLLGEPDDG